LTQSRSNDLYAWTGHGNLTSDPTSGNSYVYSSENLLTSATVGGNAVTAAYDPLLRLTQVAGAATTKFGYDGLDTTIEADAAGTTILRRYAPGDGTDEPVVWYEGAGTADRRWLHADERSSIVSVSDASGNMLAINTYDEFGKPGASNQGRFQYTGQKWIAEIGLYDYKNRMYAPALGRFPQTDPIGYGGGPNLYAYVRGDPVNLTDPLGLDDAAHRPYVRPNYDEIFVNGSKFGSCGEYCVAVAPGNVSGYPSGPTAVGDNQGGAAGGEIVVTGTRIHKPTPPARIPAPFPTWQSAPVVVAAAAEGGSKQDYCGSKGTEWVPEGDWAEACKIHDDCYGRPGSNKALCDAQLGMNVTAACTQDIWLPPICAVPGVIYWFGVTVGGWGPYERGQKRR
jgi:RHS repeat-associated protein